MEIIQADLSHEAIVLDLLDQFRTHCIRIVSPESDAVSNTAKENGSKMFGEVLRSTTSAIYLAKDGETYIGIMTIHLIPLVRKGCYAAEIEDMFVQPVYQGTGVAKKMMDAVVDRARTKDAKSIRLESGNELTRAHGFYKKYGFVDCAIAFELKI